MILSGVMPSSLPFSSPSIPCWMVVVVTPTQSKQQQWNRAIQRSKRCWQWRARCQVRAEPWTRKVTPRGVPCSDMCVCLWSAYLYTLYHLLLPKKHLIYLLPVVCFPLLICVLSKNRNNTNNYCSYLNILMCFLFGRRFRQPKAPQSTTLHRESQLNVRNYEYGARTNITWF